MSTQALPKLEDKDRVFNLQFKAHGLVSFKMFNFKGTLNQAVVRGRSHCEKMGYKFISVWVAIVDLDHQEKMRDMYSDYDGLQENEAPKVI